MRLIVIIYYLIFFNNINSLKINKFYNNKISIQNNYFLKQFNYNINDNFIIKKPINNNNIIVKKINNYKKLMRVNNCFPSFLLNLIGAWLVYPSKKIFFNGKFWVTTFLTQLTMMNSMVINDIYDLKIDIENKKDRPLVDKSISINEAKVLYMLNFFIIYKISNKYLKNSIFNFVMIINLILFIYTPVLKKIPVIKNLTCASVIGTTVLFTSSSISNINYPLLYKIKNINLIYFTSVMMFLSSIYIELLLDIIDKDGDEKYGIITVPNYFGNDITIHLLLTLMIMYYVSSYYLLKSNKLFLGYSVSFFSFIKNLFKIKISNYSHETIKKSLKETTYALLLYVFFIMINVS
jgi:4-hydroxybenzoate polyprenyltransferase